MVYKSQADHTIIPDSLTTLVTLEQEDNFYKTCYEICFAFSIQLRALNYEVMNLLYIIISEKNIVKISVEETVQHVKAGLTALQNRWC
jgi:hypothetical protein